VKYNQKEIGDICSGPICVLYATKNDDGYEYFINITGGLLITIALIIAGCLAAYVVRKKYYRINRDVQGTELDNIINSTNELD